MSEARLIDTNVLIVASAADAGSPFKPDATPVQEAEYRQKVLAWLHDFEQDAQRYAVLDLEWLICGEYDNKLTHQDYGWLAIMAKMDRNEVVWVALVVDNNGIAVLPPELSDAVTDLADRKMVAAVLAAAAAGHPCKLVNACDTDWLDCEAALMAAHIETEHLLEHEWLRPKWRSMRQHKATS
ncbi:MAG: hypothetical protein LBF16_08790 [Pseudomonadales bacterium]|jgi:hypothetical protein|nr:hypothetical protein [Pseudomonadales bacterium]